MKRGNLIPLWQVFNDIQNIKEGNVKFFYGIEKNKRLIQSEIEVIDILQKMVPELEPYEKERLEILNRLAKKDEEGNPIKKQVYNTFVYDFDDSDVVIKEINELQSKYPEAFKKQDKKNQELMEFLNEEINVDLYKIKLEHLPASLSSQQVGILYDIIEG